MHMKINLVKIDAYDNKNLILKTINNHYPEKSLLAIILKVLPYPNNAASV